MIFGIGSDIVKISRMKKNLDRWGERFAHRMLSDYEFSQFQQSGTPAWYLSKRFAAKEAAAKALGSGFRDGLSLKHISVKNNELGKPELVFSGKAEVMLRQFNIAASHITLSDEDDYAIAFVVLER